MGPATPFIMVGLGAASIYQGIQADRAARNVAAQQEDLARQNAIAVEAEARESERRARIDQETAMAEGRARAAASGVTIDGSMDLFLTEQDRLFDMEIDWLRRAAQSQASIATRTGQIEAAATRAQGQQALWSGVTQGISMGLAGADKGGWFKGTG